MNEIKQLLYSLSKSKFRGSFHLNLKMKQYVQDKGIDTIIEHAYDFVNKRLKPSYPNNDGKQTPMKQSHPVFVAQHATGTCCRGCIEKIHHIPKGIELTQNEIDYIVTVIIEWIKIECDIN